MNGDFMLSVGVGISLCVYVCMCVCAGVCRTAVACLAQREYRVW